MPLPLGLSLHSPGASHRRTTFCRNQASYHPSHLPIQPTSGAQHPRVLTCAYQRRMFDPYGAHHTEPPSSRARDRCGLHSCSLHFLLCLLTKAGRKENELLYPQMSILRCSHSAYPLTSTQAGQRVPGGTQGRHWASKPLELGLRDGGYLRPSGASGLSLVPVPVLFLCSLLVLAQ